MSVDSASVSLNSFAYRRCAIFFSIVDPLSGSFATLVRLANRLLTFGGIRSRNLGQISDSDQVVDGGSELEDPTHQLHSAVSGFAHQPHRLQPTEDFFYTFTLTLTNFITRVDAWSVGRSRCFVPCCFGLHAVSLGRRANQPRSLSCRNLGRRPR